MTTPHEIPNTMTPLTIVGVWNGLLLQWETLGVPVTQAAVNLKLAHVHLETGMSSCHCFNLGNLKSVDGDGRSWTYFTCGEEIPHSRLQAVSDMDPGGVVLIANYIRNGVDWCSIKVKPRHPWSKFCAFESLSEGMGAQLGYLRNPKHAAVLAALQTGDPVQYNAALVRAGYYTANPAGYLKTLQDRLVIVCDATADYDWGDVPA